MKYLIFVLFIVLNGFNFWAQTGSKHKKVVVYRPKNFRVSLVAVKVYVNDSLALVLRNGNYGSLEKISINDNIVVKAGKLSDTVQMSNLPHDLEKAYLRICWEHRLFLFTRLSLLPIYESFALPEIKQLEPHYDSKIK